MSNYAIVVGVNHYTSTAKHGLRTLKGAINDAKKVAKWLRKSEMVPESNLFLLTSNKGLNSVIKNEVDNAIANIIENVVTKERSDADRLYFYFAGHGMGIENNIDNNALCLSNWNEFMFDAATLSSSDYKRKFISEGFFKEVILWMDCCRNTKIRLNPSPSSGINFKGKNQSPKYFYGIATAYENSAYESVHQNNGVEETRGIFTDVLIKGLEGAAIANDGTIDAESLSGYLHLNVPIESQKIGSLQRPEIYHNTSIVNRLMFN